MSQENVEVVRRGFEVMNSIGRTGEYEEGFKAVLNDSGVKPGRNSIIDFEKAGDLRSPPQNLLGVGITIQLTMPAEIRSGRTISDVALALRVLALYSGNIARASKALVDAGEQVSPRTLARWRDNHPDLYWDLQREAEQDAAQATVIQALTICEARLESLGRLVRAFREPGPA